MTTFNEAVQQDQPDWITYELDQYDIESIIQGGCASSAYMPAVTYYQANLTMSECGDEVLDYVESAYGELPQPPVDTNWSGLAVFYLSIAVELWCSQFEGYDFEQNEEE